MRGVLRPPTVPADRAGLPEDEEVIGVVVGGEARAYQLKALHVGRHHVVNDLIGGVPISVAYCDISNCTRVFTRRGATEPLDVWQSGFGRGGLILKIEGVAYRHQTGEPLEPGPGVPPIPYEDYPWIRATWGTWRRDHPGTEIYLLGGATGHAQSPRPAAGGVGQVGVMQAAPGLEGPGHGVRDGQEVPAAGVDHRDPRADR
jgi:hypothetical protein